jgi:hypothetical protein
MGWELKGSGGAGCITESMFEVQQRRVMGRITP